MKMKLLFAISVPFIFFIANAHASLSITNGLVAAYEFEGNANDSTANANHGTVYGATLASDRFGNSNSAYAFDGNDYILASASFLPAAERTVALWFNADTVSNKPNLIGYGGSTSTPPGKSWLMGINHWGYPAYSVTCHYGTNTLQYYYDEEPVGEWFHYAITTESSGTRIYINGVEMESNSTFINNTLVDGTDLAIGVSVSKYGYAPYTDRNVGYFIGSMDDVLIYDRALSPTEIERLSTVPIPAAFWLLGSGLVGLVGLRSRVKN
jgi:hypothetical protein